MTYLIVFLEGIITFLSPCLLPMLPLYLLYFAGNGEQKTLSATLKNALGFMLGFTLIFLLLGLFAGTVGGLLRQYQWAVDLITGLVVVLFGLQFMGVLHLGLLSGTHKLQSSVKPAGFFSSLLFGLVFSIGWTPCVGAFLGSALMLASQQGSALAGGLMLLLYSLGLGLPFVLSALLIDRLKGAFGWLKAHYRGFELVCGGLLVVLGILMMTGLMSRLMSLLG